MIYRGSLDDSGSTWTNNVILGDASSTTVGSDTLGYNGSGVDVFASAAISGDSSFTSNTYLYPASTYGGGISAEEGSTLSVSGGTFNGNQASDGGAISVQEGSTLSVSGGTFDGNQAIYGGGIRPSTPTSPFSAHTSPGMTSQFSGGAIGVGISFSGSTTPQLIVKESAFVGNQAGYAGGGIDTLGATASIAGSLFSTNQVSGFDSFSLASGGAIAPQEDVFSYPTPDQSISAGCDRVHVHRQPGFAPVLRVQYRPGWGYLGSDCDDRHRQRSSPTIPPRATPARAGPSPTTRVPRPPSFVLRSWGIRLWANITVRPAGRSPPPDSLNSMRPRRPTLSPARSRTTQSRAWARTWKAAAHRRRPVRAPLPWRRASPSRVRPLRAIRPQGLRWAVLFSRSYRVAPSTAQEAALDHVELLRR